MEGPDIEARTKLLLRNGSSVIVRWH
jgi:hypothetical protein